MEKGDCQTPEAPFDADVFSLVQGSDFGPARASKPPAVKAADEAPAPLKRIPLGFLTVNGREEPVFAPIRGFEHLFAHKDVAAPWSPPSPPPPPQNTGKSREAQATEPALRSRKRQRTHNQDDDDAQYADEEGESTAKILTSFSIGDVDSLKHFYTVRLRELTMKPLRDVVTAWVRRLEPQRQKKYGPYHRYDTKRQSVKPLPLWWPVDVPYIEPSHLKLQHLVPLAVDIMLIHRRIDEEVGKRNHPSWISLLETDALYFTSLKDTEHFSSSLGAEYNKAMKKRALEIILPNVFDIAKSHEDYVAQHDLYEGSGNQDPGYAQVSWQATPRPERGLQNKRPCPPRKYDDDSDETEVDEEADGSSSTLSSFGSTSSVDIKKEEVEPSSTLSCTEDVREEAAEYTEDIKMFPSPVSDELPPTPEVAATQPLYQPPTPTSDAHHSMDRLHLYQDDSKPRLQSPISVAPHRPTNLPYVFPHETAQGPYLPYVYHETAQGPYIPYVYHETAQGPYQGPYLPYHETAQGPYVVPHDVALGGALGAHDSHMLGLPDSNHMHGLSDSRQMHGFPNSYSLPMHQVSAHGFPTVC